MDTNIIQLTVWEGDYGIASVDTESLIALTYLKFAKIKCPVIYDRNPLRKVPRLLVEVDGKRKEYLGTEVTTYLLEQDMSIRKDSKTYTFFIYVHTTLRTGLDITHWHLPSNMDEVTRPWILKAMQFPLNFIYVHFKSKYHYSHIQMLKDDTKNENVIEQVIKLSEQCISDLSITLGDKQYFADSKPGSIDALIYGFLATFINTPFVSSTLQQKVKEYPNLIEYVKHITSNEFPEIKPGNKYLQKKPLVSDPEEDTTPPLTIAIVCVIVTSTMISFGIWNDIIPWPIFH